MEKHNQPKARAARVANLMGDDKAKYEMMQTKVRPVIYAKVKRIAKRMGLTDYVIIQMMVDCIVRYMDSQHNLTPEMEKIMAIFEHMEGWGNAFNHADPTVKRIVGEAVYFLFDEEGKKKGCRAVHVTKPFFGNWTEDLNIQHILERVICLMMPERYRRLRSLAVDMDCSSLLELFDHLIDLHAQDSDVATFRQLFEDANRSEWGAKPSDVRYKRVRAKHLNEEPTFFTDLNDSDRKSDEDLDFEDQIIKP